MYREVVNVGDPLAIFTVVKLQYYVILWFYDISINSKYYKKNMINVTLCESILLIL